MISNSIESNRLHLFTGFMSLFPHSITKINNYNNIVFALIQRMRHFTRCGSNENRLSVNKYYVAALHTLTKKTRHRLVWLLHFHSIALALWHWSMVLICMTIHGFNQPTDRNRIVLFYARIDTNSSGSSNSNISSRMPTEQRPLFHNSTELHAAAVVNKVCVCVCVLHRVKFIETWLLHYTQASRPRIRRVYSSFVVFLIPLSLGCRFLSFSLLLLTQWCVYVRVCLVLTPLTFVQLIFLFYRKPVSAALLSTIAVISVYFFKICDSLTQTKSSQLFTFISLSTT